MNVQHPEIELYINAGSDEQNRAIRELLDALELDRVVKDTLVAAGVAQAVMVTLLITDDEGIQDLNKQYRQQNKPTDVLSFPLLEQPLVDAPAEQLWMANGEDAGGSQEANAVSRPAFVTPAELITNLGDIVVSWPTMLLQAMAAGHSAEYELLYLIAHGVLHLVGYDDQSEAGYHKMVAIQQSVLHGVGRKA